MANIERLFPLQTSYPDKAAPGPLSIPWAIAEKAYSAYVQKHGRGQTLERLAERGGFSWCEMDILYPPWRDETDALKIAEARVRELETERDRLARALERLSEFESLAHDAAFDRELHAGSLREILGEISAAIEDAKKGGA